MGGLRRRGDSMGGWGWRGSALLCFSSLARCSHKALISPLCILWRSFIMGVGESCVNKKHCLIKCNSDTEVSGQAEVLYLL